MTSEWATTAECMKIETVDISSPEKIMRPTLVDVSISGYSGQQDVMGSLEYSASPSPSMNVWARPGSKSVKSSSLAPASFMKSTVVAMYWVKTSSTSSGVVV